MHVLRRFLRLTYQENRIELQLSEQRRNSILDMVFALDARMDSNVLKAWRLHA
jgi:hypothetical protein